MNDHENEDVLALDSPPYPSEAGGCDRPVIYVVPDDVADDEVGFDQETAEYVLAQVEDDYEEVLVFEAISEPDLDGEVIPLEDIVLNEHDLEVA
jgi:hypothetical protein